jgi:flagellum-specific peptidoglycan hydrolase FlgJ
MAVRTCLALLLALTFIPLNAPQAKMYKWVDKDGNVTYSQLKPPNVKAETVKLHGVQSVSEEQAKERLNNLTDKADTARKDREFESTATAETKERNERLKENCETARQNLRVLKTGARVKSTDSNTGGSFLTDEQKAAQLAQANKNIENNCN